jgi:hypothetical protein
MSTRARVTGARVSSLHMTHVRRPSRDVSFTRLAVPNATRRMRLVELVEYADYL